MKLTKGIILSLAFFFILGGYLRAQEKLSALKLTEKPEEPKPAPPASQKKTKKK